MASSLFYKNIERRFFDITIQIEHASSPGISNQAKSGYYRFAILLACTIVEALLFKLVEVHIKRTSGFMAKVYEYKDPHNIPSKYLNEDAVICLRKEKVIDLSNHTKFNDLIIYANKNKLISKKSIVKIKNIMKMRNRIHLQSLNSKDCGYTKKELIKVFDTIDLLLSK